MAVTADMKVSDVLKQYPQLLDVLIKQSPEFQRLRNPVLRKVMTRLVTLRQAAAMAGLDPAELVATLNRALGIEAPQPPSVPIESRTGERPEWARDELVAVDLDVREMQRRHEEPFSRIMQAVGAVPAGRIFRLRNTFEPLPLYEVLGKRGFKAWAMQLAEDDWITYFYREAPAPSRSSQDSLQLPANAKLDTADKVVDIIDLVPPEPMIKVLTALEEMEPDRTLLVNHQRRPIYLLQVLDERGYPYRVVEHDDGRVQVYIYKPRS